VAVWGAEVEAALAAIHAGLGPLPLLALETGGWVRLGEGGAGVGVGVGWGGGGVFASWRVWAGG